MADSPIRDGGDQPLDDEPSLPIGGPTVDTEPEERVGEHAPGDERQLPAGGEPGLPYPNADRDGQADFVGDATGARYEHAVDDGLARIDEHRARIDELEAEQPGSPTGASGRAPEPGPGAPDVPAGAAGGTGDAEPDSGAPDPSSPGLAQAAEASAAGVPQGAGTLDPAAPVGDPAGDASALDDTDRAQP